MTTLFGADAVCGEPFQRLDETVVRCGKPLGHRPPHGGWIASERVPPDSDAAQRTHLDAAAAEDAAVRGMTMSEEGKPALVAAFDRAVRAAAAKHALFCADQVWVELGDIPAARGAASAMGPALRRAAAAGLITTTGDYRKSERKVAHAKPLPLWRSLVHA